MSSASDADQPPEPARLRQALVERLDDIERKIEGELVPAENDSRNSVEQFLGDVADEARDAGSRFLRALSGPRELVVRLAGALAGSAKDSSGVDVRLRDVIAEALRPIARGWLGLRLRSEAPLPQRGGVLVAFNRSGWPLPAEAMIVAAALAERARRRDVFVLWDAAVAATPGLGAAMRRVGVLAAEPRVAHTLLGRGAFVVSFPEGGSAGLKSYANRYKLGEFTDRFVVEEAREAKAAILPGAIVGHEESYPVLGRIAGLPLTPMFPLAGPLGLLPLPLGWRIRVGVALDDGDEADGADAEIEKVLRTRMQAMLGEMLSERHSIVRG